MRLTLVIIAGAALIAGCRDGYQQTAVECEAKMLQPILDKVARLPSDTALRDGKTVVEHQLLGPENRILRLAELLSQRGHRISAGLNDEINYRLTIAENAVSFKHQAAAHVSDLCRFAAVEKLKYRTWWLSGAAHSDYFTQSETSSNVVEEVPDN